MLRTFRYEEIAGELRRQIQEKAFERLPSERSLMERYGVQRDTVRRALGLLASEGQIVIEGRRGAFVASAGSPSKPAPAGTILAVAAWNEASTANESWLRGLSQALEGTALSLLYFDSRPKAGQVHHEIPALEYLEANQVVGVALWPQSPTDLEALQRLRAAVPLVLIDRSLSGFETDCVGFDNVGGGQAITRHLLDRGHTRIGFLGDEVFAETVQQRWRGYTRALEAAGIAVDTACVALFNGIRNPPFSEYLRIFLAGAGRPLTAVVCSNDSVAAFLLHALRQEGLRAPEDIAVTGYGDLLPNANGALRLTTVAQPFEELGRVVGKLLQSRLTERATGTARAEYRKIEIPVHLVIRASCGALRSGAGGLTPPGGG